MGNTVTVYASGTTSVLDTISEGVNEPYSLALDGSGNLYVANLSTSTVTVYASGSTSVLRTISQGVSWPTALAFDDSGNLYVTNLTGGTVTVYAPGQRSGAAHDIERRERGDCISI